MISILKYFIFPFILLSSFLVFGAAKPPPAPATANSATSDKSLAVESGGKWLKLPSFDGVDSYGSTIRFKPKKGHVAVVIFIASWCIPCQNLIDKLLKLQQDYQSHQTDFYYVFSHDLSEDIRGFQETYHLQEAIVANNELLKSYHSPMLPTIYIGDRHGFLLTRFEKFSGKDLPELEKILKLLTAF